MRSILQAISNLFIFVALPVQNAEAKRFGGGRGLAVARIQQQ